MTENLQTPKSRVLGVKRCQYEDTLMLISQQKVIASVLDWLLFFVTGLLSQLTVSNSTTAKQMVEPTQKKNAN